MSCSAILGTFRILNGLIQNGSQMRPKKARPQFAYFPFGGGARVCIGEHFAKMEGTLVLASIAQRFRLSLVPGQTIVPEPKMTLRPKHGLMMRVQQRNPATSNSKVCVGD